MTTTSDEVTTNPGAARVQIIPAPLVSPGVCGFCGKSKSDKGFITFGLDFEFYGTLIFCPDCVGDMATAFGWLQPEKAVQLALHIKELEAEVALHREALLNLESALDHLTNYRILHNTIADSDSNAGVRSDADEESEELTEAVSATVHQLVTGSSESESNSDELTSEQGPDDVSGSTSGESSIDIIPL